ncbi:MATE family efflux transporter [Rhodospirillum rubrum]|uniref:Multidrug-efflux transporter n=3 Tax=Rhodospirillum rubrum TaxID=1085 RepID=Q2RWJ4_RHORT|nr:MATE family efflux transporter [Rhodospirillum rubrum]ABC21501.1 Multi antimicrobial extrusion protein MatE [Rhodospirillum rubrum ATCC 11170]HAQ01483.1 MATE family efflux transporter [Rhodospirillum rubrum]
MISSSVSLPRSGHGAWRTELGATLSLAWPLILTNLAQAALTTTDLLLIGSLGSRSLAAAAMAAGLFQALMLFGLGLVSATLPLLATALGRNRHSVRDVRRTVRQGLWSAGLISLPLWLILWHTEAVLIAFGQEPALAAEAAGFMHTLQWGLLPFLGYIVLRAFLSALERPMWPLLVAGLAIGFNALAAWALIFGHLGLPALGLPGAGVSSSLSSLFMVAGLALVITRQRRLKRYRLFGRFWRPDWPRLVTLWRLGLPMAISFAFEVSIFQASMMMMGILGADALAAHTIALQIATLTFMVPLGLGQAATVRVGRALGAGTIPALRRAGWVAYGAGVAFMGGAALMMLSVPRLLIGAFLDADLAENAPVIDLAVVLMALAALFQIADGAQAVCNGMLRGLHDTKVPMLLAALGYWGLGLPLGALLAFPLGVGAPGVWIGLAGGLSVVAVLMTRRWIRLVAALERASVTA